MNNFIGKTYEISSFLEWQLYTPTEADNPIDEISKIPDITSYTQKNVIYKLSGASHDNFIKNSYYKCIDKYSSACTYGFVKTINGTNIMTSTKFSEDKPSQSPDAKKVTCLTNTSDIDNFAVISVSTGSMVKNISKFINVKTAINCVYGGEFRNPILFRNNVNNTFNPYQICTQMFILDSNLSPIFGKAGDKKIISSYINNTIASIVDTQFYNIAGTYGSADTPITINDLTNNASNNAFLSSTTTIQTDITNYYSTSTVLYNEFKDIINAIVLNNIKYLNPSLDTINAEDIYNSIIK